MNPYYPSTPPLATPKLNEALAKAQAEMKLVGKSGQNTFDKYEYAKLEDYVQIVHPVLHKHGLALVSSVDHIEQLPNRPTSKGGTEYAVRVKLTMILSHTSGEQITATAYGEGQDRADKAIYKAITGARKYGLAAMFNLATGDDPESDEQVGNTPGTRPASNGHPNGSRAAAVADKAAPKATPGQIKQIELLARQTGSFIDKICGGYKVKSLAELTLQQANEVVNILSDRPKRVAVREPGADESVEAGEAVGA